VSCSVSTLAQRKQASKQGKRGKKKKGKGKIGLIFLLFLFLFFPLSSFFAAVSFFLAVRKPVAGARCEQQRVVNGRRGPRGHDGRRRGTEDKAVDPLAHVRHEDMHSPLKGAKRARIGQQKDADATQRVGHCRKVATIGQVGAAARRERQAAHLEGEKKKKKRKEKRKATPPKKKEAGKRRRKGR
jgi:hypothetical protein